MRDLPLLAFTLLAMRQLGGDPARVVQDGVPPQGVCGFTAAQRAAARDLRASGWQARTEAPPLCASSPPATSQIARASGHTRPPRRKLLRGPSTPSYISTMYAPRRVLFSEGRMKMARRTELDMPKAAARFREAKPRWHCRIGLHGWIYTVVCVGVQFRYCRHCLQVQELSAASTYRWVSNNTTIDMISERWPPSSSARSS